jgi:hypothetical protein
LIEEEMRNCTFKPETNVGERSRHANAKLPPKSNLQKIKIEDSEIISEIAQRNNKTLANKPEEAVQKT